MKFGTTPIDWEMERRKFPCVSRSAYLMTAAVGPISDAVYQSYLGHYRTMHEYGDYQYQANIEILEQARKLAALYLNAESHADIGFSPNTSHGMNLTAIMLKERLGVGAEVLMPKDEFPSSSIPWLHHGFRVRFAVHPRELISEISSETKVIVCSAVQYGTGYRAPLESIGEVADEKGICFIVNATQALGVFETDVRRAKVSVLTASCHKWLCAGYGASIFYASPSFRSDSKWPFAGWLSVEDSFLMRNDTVKPRAEVAAIETGVPPFAVTGAIGVALREVQRMGLGNISARVHGLSDVLAKKLQDTGFKLLSERDSVEDFRNSINSGTVLIEFPGADKAVERLVADRIYVTARSGGIRASIHYFNSETDVDRLVWALKRLQ